MSYKEPLDKATKAIERTVQHAEEVRQSVPARTETRQDTSEREKGSLRPITFAEDAIKALMRPLPASESAKFEEAAKGHEEPAINFPSNGGPGVWDKILVYMGDAAPYLIRSELSNRGDPYVTDKEARAEDVRAHTAVYSGDVVANWMTPEYLGEEIAGRFSRSPPFANVPEDMKEGTAGFYLSGSNSISLDPGFKGTYEDIQYALSHEMLHYASYLGGGGGVRFIDEQGNKRVAGDITWFNEGLTDLHSQQLCREKGVTPSFIGYETEIQVAFYLQKLLGEGGEEKLKTAYLSGDFTEVRKAIDAKLGAGTFDQLIAKERGVEALVFLRGKMAEEGINTSSWDKDPIMVAAWLEGA